MRFLCTVITLLFLSPALHGANLKDLQARLAHTKEVRAHIEQTKTAPYLLRPLVSDIDFSFDGTTIRWQTRRPLEQLVLITSYSISVDGKTMPPQAQQEFRPLMQVLFHLLRGETKFLQEQYSLHETPDQMVITARSKGPFEYLKVTLHAPTTLQIAMTSGAEVTSLMLRDLQLSGEGKRTP